MAGDKLFDDSPQAPGDRLRELLEEKGWTQDELASITGRSRQQIIDIVAKRRRITPEMAVALAAAFGLSATYWLTLEAIYRLSQVNEPKDAIMERARLFDLAPIKDMQKRGWIPETKSTDELVQHLTEFFEVGSLDEQIGFPLATRKATLGDLTPAQRAWCFRARHLARIPIVSPFDPLKLDQAGEKLRQLAAYRTEAVHVAEVLAKFGIRFVVIEPLPGAKIDGVTFWLDENSPVIAVSLRYDRHDYFWFTLMHEFMHVVHGDSLSIDCDLGREEDHAPTLLKDEIEKRADEGAAATLVPQEEIDSFIRRVGPLYSQTRIVQFAHSIKMHPGVIVGQLQNRGEVGWNALRETLAKVRDLVTDTALTDGWGHVVELE
jgi:HTH-type transcriptional regulator / antitoxin HigA